MIADNFWKFLAAVLVVAGLVFWFKTRSTKRDFNNTALEMAEMVAYGDDTKPRNQRESDERFIKAVALLHYADQNEMERAKLFAAVHEENGFSPEGGHARLINSRLEESLATCRKLGILDDETSRDLDEGVKVKINSGPYKGEKITITQHVPPSVGANAEFFAGNLLIVPESIAFASENLVVTDKMREVAEKLRNAEIITEGEMKTIKDALGIMRKRAKTL